MLGVMWVYATQTRSFRGNYVFVVIIFRVDTYWIVHVKHNWIGNLFSKGYEYVNCIIST